MTKGNGKPCKKCGTSEWYDAGKCKVCSRNRSKERYENMSDEDRSKGFEKLRQWSKDNRERYLETCRRWHKDNPERHAANNRRWREENPEEWKNIKSNWEENNPGRMKELQHEWGKSNRDKRAVIKNRYRTRKTEAGGSYTTDEFDDLCKQYGNVCLCCKKKKKLVADHVIPVSKGGTSYISNIQPLCDRCNKKKAAKTTDYR